MKILTRKILAAAANLFPYNQMIFNHDFYLNDSYFKLDWSAIELTGVDAISFLDRQTTNDIKNLKEHSFQINSLLTPDGKIDSFFILTKKQNNISLYLPKNNLLKTIERIEKYHIMEDFNLESTQSISLYFHFGPSVFKDYFNGEFFGISCGLVFDQPLKNIKELEPQNTQLILDLIGYDEFVLGKLFTKTLLSQYAYSSTKGCFPGQEPVSKIVNNRGAAYYPALLEVEKIISLEQFFYQDQLVAKNLGSFEYAGKDLHKVELLRDFRVNNKEMVIDTNTESKGIVRYYPYHLLNNEQLAHLYFEKAAKLSLKKETYPLAKVFLMKILSLDPNHEDAVEIMGVLNASEEQYKEAIKWMKKLKEINPLSVMAETNLSLYFMKLGDIETAEKHKAEATFLSFKAMAPKENQNEVEQNRKIGMFKKVISIDETDTMANLGLGQIYYEQEKLDLAKSHLEKVIQTDPKYSQAYLFLGKTLVSLKQVDRAKEILTEGIPVATKKGELMPANEMEVLLKSLN